MSFVQRLENRCLLSASVDGLALFAPTQGPLGAVEAPLATTRRAAMRNILGKYSGTLTPTGSPVGMPGMVVIRTQKSTGPTTAAITGSLIVNGFHIKFKVSGTLNKDNTFSINGHKNGITGSVQGKIDKKGNMSGTFTVMGFTPAPITGKFKLLKLS